VVDSLGNGSLPVPQVFAFSPEFELTDYDSFNSGIMLANISGMLLVYNDMLSIFQADNWDCSSETFDQSCLRHYCSLRGLMKDQQSKLAPQWHWKPYLKWPDDRVPPGQPLHILHFHGPKPEHIIDYFISISSGKPTDHIHSSLLHLLKRNPWGYVQGLLTWFCYAPSSFHNSFY